MNQNEFNLTIIGPEKTIFQGPAVSLIAKTPTGDLGILAHHAPLVATLKEGEIEYTLATGGKKTFKLNGGLLKVGNNQVTVIYT
ncbi:MAG: F0F1 ATP synthase subunit epsilon [Candidatus Margulisiibacteriota bacterium]